MRLRNRLRLLRKNIFEVRIHSIANVCLEDIQHFQSRQVENPAAFRTVSENLQGLEILHAILPMLGNLLDVFSNDWNFRARFFQPLETAILSRPLHCARGLAHEDLGMDDDRRGAGVFAADERYEVLDGQTAHPRHVDVHGRQRRPDLDRGP